ncbi:zinc-dependent alcohol dehydrogenase [Pontibacter sp. SGAir0037]|uniref:zinc-dependent alcohol dehydrogenase n=1 Tax=Pontibacter sp. SGAir0037 TaxID=2571030 RepID=UPI0010CCD964|nr:zinc-dependent alcohol dehydrogenase [Pontibacter sp. SGAir0037]QCR21883.1 glutathione-dependent formaldehyde dehydrogenase [Pontibacter sp. SGAir0037]
MKAVRFHMPKVMKVDNVPDPGIEDARDIILKVTSTAICGSDLHIYNGKIPQIENLIVGHEFMGEVVETGKAITNLKKGDRVVVPFPISCGQCFFCQHDLYPHCENSNEKHYGPEGALLDQKGAALFGYTNLYGGYAGGQAEYVRVPFADVGPRKVPDMLTDEQALFLTDIFPTGYIAVDWANLKGGETVVVFGCGPVGIMAQKSAWLKGAGRVIGVDIQPYRLKKAQESANSEVINAAEQDVIQLVRDMTQGRGADVCIDAVGMEADRTILEKALNTIRLQAGTTNVLENCFSAVRRGGVVSVVGVYGSYYDKFPLGQFFDKGLIMRAGQAPVQAYIDTLLKLVEDGKVVLDDIITHKLPLSEAPHAYKIFNNKEDDCVKVVLKP